MSAMRGMDEMQEPLFATVKLEDFVPADHPLRPICSAPACHQLEQVLCVPSG